MLTKPRTHNPKEGRPHLILAHVDEVALGQLLVRLRVVRVRVEHDERERQHVCPVRCPELAGIVAAVPLRKLLHDALDLLSLACIGRPSIGEQVVPEAPCHICS